MPLVFDNVLTDHSNYLSIGNNTFHYIYDCNENKFEYLSSSFTEETGYAMEDALSNPQFTLTPINFFSEIIPTLDELINSFISLNKQHYKQYTLFYYYPLIHNNGYIYPCLAQVRILELDKKEKVKFVFAYNQIIKKNYDYNKPFNISFISNNRQFTSFYEIENLVSLQQAIKVHSLSKREIQILKLVSKGYSNITISEKLNISVHTISTHKKNILSKTNTPNIMVTIQKAILQKII